MEGWLTLKKKEKKFSIGTKHRSKLKQSKDLMGENI